MDIFAIEDNLVGYCEWWNVFVFYEVGIVINLEVVASIVCINWCPYELRIAINVNEVILGTIHVQHRSDKGLSKVFLGKKFTTANPVPWLLKAHKNSINLVEGL